MIGRRSVLSLPAAALAAACTPRPEPSGGFAGGASFDRGHRLYEPRPIPAPARTHRTRVVIAGGGIAGLAAARALRLRGIEDFALLELEDQAGGNSRAGRIAGIACPQGAHYLPVPSDDAPQVQDFLEELGLRKRVAGRWSYDERHRVHSPQERLYFEGRWQDGLVPLEGVGASTLAQYRRFAQRLEELRRSQRFAIPMALRSDARAALALDALTFAAWLDREGLDDAHLRWLLDYCCRDDYGAGLATVSAWAGLHYFAARHGFHPQATGDSEREGLLTWPEGNAFLAQALIAPLGQRLRSGRTVLRIAETRAGVELDAFDTASGQVERWQAAHCIVALPVFIAARVLEDASPVLQQRARRKRLAPWIVVNLHLDGPLRDRPGAELAWDNVVYGTRGLGYVVATHQHLDPRPGPTVLTWYCAPGEDARPAVLQAPWEHWRDLALSELSAPHPDLRERLTRAEVTRYGHAMSIPVPGTLAQGGPPPAGRRLSWAHADWAGYSIFEEAFALGDAAGRRA